jgi:hypothetical protein
MRRSGLWRWSKRVFAVVSSLLVLAICFGTAYQAIASRLFWKIPAPGVRIDVGGHKLHLYCQGQGSNHRNQPRSRGLVTPVAKNSRRTFSEHTYVHVRPQRIWMERFRLFSADRSASGRGTPSAAGRSQGAGSIPAGRRILRRLRHADIRR